MKKLVFLLLPLIFACTDLYEVPEVHYRIEAGSHESKVVNGFSLDKMRTMKSNRLVFTARFDNSARYDLNHNDHFDINKLMGFSEANSHHQENSARLGWRFNIDKDAIEIFSYVYSKGDLSYEHITDIEINATIEYQINMYSNEYEFVVNGYSQRIERNIENEVGLYYRLFPYFGGNQVAPQNINIYIKEVF